MLKGKTGKLLKLVLKIQAYSLSNSVWKWVKKMNKNITLFLLFEALWLLYLLALMELGSKYENGFNSFKFAF